VLMGAVLFDTVAAVWSARVLRRPTLDPVRDFTAKQRVELIERDGPECVYCRAVDNAPGVRLQCDHIDPWIEGGRTHIVNGQMLCQPCNRLKTDKTDAEARRLFRKKHGFEAGHVGRQKVSA
jgi:5-methylcytosine-specific restriction endonuclease McrA